MLMVYKQGDLGTASVFFVIAASMLFVAGLDKKYIFTFIGLGVLSMPILWSRLDQYQKNRILVFMNPSLDISGAGYQVYQSKIAIGSGQFSGRGVSDAKFIQGGYLPFNHTDFIFSVVGEAFGFMGGVILLALFAIFFFRLVLIAKDAKDMYGSMIVIGVTAMLFFHVLENVGMTMGLMPVTGIPLPFISYGGTFLLTCFACIGLVLSVGLRRKTFLF
jgi:rod shape determining protein RodA